MSDSDTQQMLQNLEQRLLKWAEATETRQRTLRARLLELDRDRRIPPTGGAAADGPDALALFPRKAASS